jgi:predicted aspartyl protease
VALTWSVVSASLLLWSTAAAASELKPAPGSAASELQPVPQSGTGAPSVSSIASLPGLTPAAVTPPNPQSVPAVPGGVPPPNPGLVEPDMSQVVVEAPEPRFAAPTLRDRIGRIWAPVLINGRGPYRLVLDTGATHSAIIAQVADSLGIPLAAASTVRVTGVTGSAIVPTVEVERMEVGDLSVDSTMLPIVADVFGGAQGVLGTEGLSDKRILIDFGRDRVVISRSHGGLDRSGFATLPLRQLRDHLLALDVRVGGVRAKAVIDTGAQVSIGNSALRSALERQGRRDVKKEEIEGVTLDVARGDMMKAPPIEMGNLQFNGVYITYGDMYIFDRWHLMHDPTLVLGMDVLGTVDVLVIDYRLRELQIRLRHS